MRYKCLLAIRKLLQVNVILRPPDTMHLTQYESATSNTKCQKRQRPCRELNSDRMKSSPWLNMHSNGAANEAQMYTELSASIRRKSKNIYSDSSESQVYLTLYSVVASDGYIKNRLVSSRSNVHF